MDTAQAFLDESSEEQRSRREYGDTHGYQFIVARSIDPDAPRVAQRLLRRLAPRDRARFGDAR